jgi:hypothetical protein
MVRPKHHAFVFIAAATYRPSRSLARPERVRAQRQAGAGVRTRAERPSASAAGGGERRGQGFSLYAVDKA